MHATKPFTDRLRAGDCEGNPACKNRKVLNLSTNVSCMKVIIVGTVPRLLLEMEPPFFRSHPSHAKEMKEGPSF